MKLVNHFVNQHFIKDAAQKLLHTMTESDLDELDLFIAKNSSKLGSMQSIVEIFSQGIPELGSMPEETAQLKAASNMEKKSKSVDQIHREALANAGATFGSIMGGLGLSAMFAKSFINQAAGLRYNKEVLPHLTNERIGAICLCAVMSALVSLVVYYRHKSQEMESQMDVLKYMKSTPENDANLPPHPNPPRNLRRVQ